MRLFSLYQIVGDLVLVRTVGTTTDIDVRFAVIDSLLITLATVTLKFVPALRVLIPVAAAINERVSLHEKDKIKGEQSGVASEAYVDNNDLSRLPPTLGATVDAIVGWQ